MVDAATADMMRQSQFVFQATVQSPGRSTVSDIPVDDHTVVVKIDRVLHSPAALAHSAGMDVTVQLAAGSAVPPAGEQVTFFTRPVAYSDGIAVAEVGRTTPETAGELTTMTAGPAAGHLRPHPALDIAQQQAEERLRAHAAEADAIVIGRVTQLGQARGPALREHDPDWWVATIAVDHAEKGTVGDTVQFPSPTPVTSIGSTCPSRPPGTPGYGCCTPRPELPRSWPPTPCRTPMTCSGPTNSAASVWVEVVSDAAAPRQPHSAGTVR